jgi:tetratricopeptide (TPR) repeat protein
MLHPGREETTHAYGESMTPNLQFGWSALHCLRSRRYKLIQAPRPELYDLTADPGETTNAFDRHPEVVRDLMQRLDRLVAETSRDAPEPETADLDEETVDRLAALGYIGTPLAPKTGDPKRPLADPKDKLRVFAAVQQAGELIVEEQYPAAVELLESALGEDPKMPQARLMLGGAYSEQDRTAEAKAQFDHVLKDDPKSVQALVGVASLLMREDRTEDVIALCRQVLTLDERNVQAEALLGEAHADRGEPREALTHFEKAVAIQPKLTRNRLNLAASLIEVRQYGRADRVLGEILADTPRFPFAQFNRGLLYEEQGRLEDARAAYAAEVTAYPGHFKARFNLGRVLFRLGDRSGSLQQMREVVRLAPKQPEGHLFLARGLLQENAPIDEVQALVEKGLSLARTSETRALGFFLLADVYNRKGRRDEANEALRKAQAYAPAARSESRSHANQSH